MAAAGEKDKKAVSKTVVMNVLWFFMNFCTKYECKNEILFKKLQHFPFHSCILEAKFCRTIGMVILNFLPDRHRFGLDRRSRAL